MKTKILFLLTLTVFLSCSEVQKIPEEVITNQGVMVKNDSDFIVTLPNNMKFISAGINGHGSVSYVYRERRGDEPMTYTYILESRMIYDPSKILKTRVIFKER